MKKFTLCLTLFLGALTVLAGSTMTRVQPVGYRVKSSGECGTIQSFDSSAVTVSPDGVGIAETNKPVKLLATLNRDYKIVCWQKLLLDADGNIRQLLEEFAPDSESASVTFDENVSWVYIAVVVEYDPVRTIKAKLSSFGKGKLTVSPQKSTYQKGDSVTLTVEPADGYSFVRWSDGNGDFNRMLTVNDDIDLTATVEPDSSRVTFSPGEGAILDITEKRVSFDSAYGLLPVPVRSGETFLGWLNGKGEFVTAETLVTATADHVLTADWKFKPATYTVVFDANGGTGLAMRVEQTFKVGETQALRLNTFYYSGHVFVGWNQSASAEEKQFSDQQVVTDLAPTDVTMTLYAVWRTEEVAYTVHFDKNAEDATGAMSDQEFAGGEAKPLIGCSFRRNGYSFLGWSTDSEAIDASYQDREKVQGLTTKKELTLYAIWTKNPVYYVNYLKTSADQEPSFRETVECGKSYMLAASDRLKWPGYALDSWKNGESSYSAGKMLTDQDVKKLAGDGDTIVFSANWNPIKYQIVLDGNGGTCKINNNPSDVVYGKEVEFMIADGGDWFVKRDGYDLLSYWSRDAVLTNEIYVTTGDGQKTCLVVSNLTTTADETVTLYAQWQGTNLTVTINGEPVVLRYGSELKQPEDPVKEGYLFGGWTTNGVAVTFPIVVTGSFDLEPKLTPIEYSVEFDGNGADGGSMASQSFTYDATKNLSSNGFLRTDYTFSNWTNATGDAYADGESVKNLAAEQGAVVHLYATWTKNGHYTVRFNGNGGTTTDSLATYDQDFTLDVAQALKSNDFVRTGHDFLNWTDETGVCYADGATVRNLTDKDDTTVMLYALWVEEKGNDLSIALGLPGNFITTVSAEGAWTIVGAAKECNGLQRSATNPSGTLSIKIPSAGTLKYYLDMNGSVNSFSWTYNGKSMPDADNGATSYSMKTAYHNLTFSESGELVFSGTPSSSKTWTLKEFIWTPAE